MGHSNYLSTFFLKMGKHEKYKVLLKSDELSKNVKNALSFRRINKKLLNNCFMLRMIVNILSTINSFMVEAVII